MAQHMLYIENIFFLVQGVDFICVNVSVLRDSGFVQQGGGGLFFHTPTSAP